VRDRTIIIVRVIQMICKQDGREFSARTY